MVRFEIRRAHRHTDAMQKRTEPALEHFDAETLSVLSESIPRPLLEFKALDRVSQIFRRLRVKEHPGHIFDYRFESATGAVGDRRPARGRNFKRRHPEIFLPRKEERAATGHVVFHVFVRCASEKMDRRSS